MANPTIPDLEPVPSKAALFGHPIHPMLIVFPVALLALVPVTDIAYAAGAGPFFAQASYIMLWAGLVSGVIAGAVGAIDFWTIPRARAHRAGWLHVGANGVVLGLSLVNALLRVNDRLSAVIPGGVMLSVIAAVVLVVAGWYGGELAYRHKIGVMQHPSERRADEPRHATLPG